MPAGLHGRQLVSVCACVCVCLCMSAGGSECVSALSNRAAAYLAAGDYLSAQKDCCLGLAMSLHTLTQHCTTGDRGTGKHTHTHTHTHSTCMKCHRRQPRAPCPGTLACKGTSGLPCCTPHGLACHQEHGLACHQEHGLLTQCSHVCMHQRQPLSLWSHNVWV